MINSREEKSVNNTLKELHEVISISEGVLHEGIIDVLWRVYDLIDDHIQEMNARDWR